MKKHYTLVDKDGHCVSCGMENGLLVLYRTSIIKGDHMSKSVAESELLYVNKKLEHVGIVNKDCALPLRVAIIETTKIIKELDATE